MGYLMSNFDRVVKLFFEHLYLVSISLFVAIMIATVLGITISKYKQLYSPIIGSLGILYTIPSIALFALMIPVFGLGFKSAFIALVAYSQMILVRNIVAGIRGIDPAIIEAARGMGMSKMMILLKIELPLALPVVIAGIRIATISVIGIATIAAYINAGGLGELIFEGIYQDHSQKIIAGTIAVAFLAVGTDICFRLIERKLSIPG